MPSDNKTAADAPAAAPNYEEKLHGFWQKNRGAIFGVCAVVLLAIAAKGGWELFNAQREKNTGAEYAAAGTSDELRAFARAHQGHQLAGVAWLRLADDEYSAGKYTDALADYASAVEALPGTPLGGRAQLGQAVCKIQSGRAIEGEMQLKQIAADLTQLLSLRAEAAYHLASSAVDEGRVDDAKKYVDQVQQIEPSGFWARRALELRAQLPADAQPGAENPPTAGPLFSAPGK